MRARGRESVLGRNLDAAVPSRPRCDRRTHRDPARHRDDPGPRRPIRLAGARATHGQDADQHRLRRRREHRRPGGVGRGAPRPEAGRQRHRRGGRGRGDAGRHRALQLGDRWRWLLRALRREDRPDRDHRRPRDRACVDAARRLHRPVDGRALQLHARAGHQRRLGRRPGQPRHLARCPRPLGHDVARPHLPPRHPRGTTGLRGRPDVPPADAGEQAALRRLPLDPPALPARRRRTRGRLGLPQPGPGAHLPPDRPPRHLLPVRRSPRSPDQPGRASPAEDRVDHAARADRIHGALRPARLLHHQPPAHPRRLSRLRRLRHAALVVRWLDRRRGAEHPGALPPEGHVRRRRPAPLPRRERAGLRRPRRLRRRPGVRRRAAARAALRPVRRGAGLPDQRDHRARRAGRRR